MTRGSILEYTEAVRWRYLRATQANLPTDVAATGLGSASQTLGASMAWGLPNRVKAKA